MRVCLEFRNARMPEMLVWMCVCVNYEHEKHTHTAYKYIHVLMNGYRQACIVNARMYLYANLCVFSQRTTVCWYECKCLVYVSI